MTTIGVTGVTGHLGRFAAEQLIAAGTDRIVGLARSPEKATVSGLDVRTGDYDRPETLVEALKGVDVLLFVSGNEVGRRIGQHTNVVEAAKAAGVGRVVYTSAPRADATELVVAPDHKATEELLRASGLEWTILRNNWYVELYTGQLTRYLADGAIVSAAGAGRVGVVPRADLAAGAVAAVTGDGHAGRIYELGGPPITLDDLAATITEVTGTTVTHRSVSPAELVAALRAGGLDEGTAGFVAAIDEAIARGDLDVPSEDLPNLLGRPVTPLAYSIRAALTP
ncbi:SDR family oxidoreductase [Virgisporangium aurantiacum]|uniref:NAD(P)-dependent oxidoreductase n=1 Tax=Virgisporangium aurantiacum TaxID=175570 RepID=A0A8J3Z4Y4_9ACTN|nr:SDR family oxidoreductase [Virgisporangium aurantiacum]GIJ55103.1 NAD(P)-dependent oxidoreductase [Virgisporangium aurantiacum]